MQRSFFLTLAVVVALSSDARADSRWPVADLALSPNEVWVIGPDGARRDSSEASAKEGLLSVDLSDSWAPFILSDSDGPGAPIKPNGYRETFVLLANDRVNPDEVFLESDAGRRAVLSRVPPELRSAEPGKLSPDEQLALNRARRDVAARPVPNFLEVYGIPPTLSVLAARVAADAGKTCYSAVDLDGLRRLDSEISYQTRDQARKEFDDALGDAAWVAERVTAMAITVEDFDPSVVSANIRAADPLADTARLDRYLRSQARLRAVRAVQARLACEGLLDPARITAAGMFDHPTHTALAAFEKKNDIFGWGFVSGETREALLRDPLELHLDTFRRILAERVADAAGIVEDGSVSGDPSNPVTFLDTDGTTRAVPNLIGDFTATLAHALGVETPQDLVDFLHAIGAQSHANLRVAFRAPPLPPYYAPAMVLSAEIDRGDIWYDLPFDAAGKPIVQRRRRYPSFTLFVTWHGQKIPLVRWRTTIGSWRSELGNDGHVYLKYKNSDVGPRIWKNIVAAPAWLPPDTTPAKDLLAKKVFDRKQGPISVVNTEVMGPGFASAYGLVMAIHLKQLEDGGLFDNQIRTHGSVDYTSIARRFSHGCHRLVNNRAVRLFDFVLRHTRYTRLGDRKLGDFKRKFRHDGRTYEYRLKSRGYYFELKTPVPITVLEGRVLGPTKAPIRQFVRKPGESYAPLAPEVAIEPQTVLGP